MKWFDRWLYGKVRDMWDNRYKYEESERDIKMATGMAIPKGILQSNNPEGEGRISFELSSAVGGRILNVRHYDPQRDRHETQTYVIPSGEDIGERVAKIINLEMFKQ